MWSTRRRPIKDGSNFRWECFLGSQIEIATNDGQRNWRNSKFQLTYIKKISSSKFDGKNYWTAAEIVSFWNAESSFLATGLRSPTWLGMSGQPSNTKLHSWIIWCLALCFLRSAIVYSEFTIYTIIYRLINKSENRYTDLILIPPVENVSLCIHS